jgi:hypothetical protein
VVDFLDDASTAPVRHGVHGDAFGQTWSKRRRIWLQAREGTRRQLEVDKAEAGRVVAVGGGGDAEFREAGFTATRSPWSWPPPKSEEDWECENREETRDREACV